MWAGMVATGRDGYLRYARSIFDTSYAMQDAVRSHPELCLIGEPSFLFAFTSDDFDIYHVNDAFRARGWRMNGLAVPERNPHGHHQASDPIRSRRGVGHRP